MPATASHLLISHAAPQLPQFQAAIASLRLPALSQLLLRMARTAQLAGTPADLSPLHERAIASHWGFDWEDGLLPWAAADALRLGLLTGSNRSGWAWITPVHWEPNSDHVRMSDPHQLALTRRDLDTLRHALEPYFVQDGITLYAQPLGHAYPRWLARGDVFAQLPTASLDRVRGQAVDAWMPRQPQARGLRRLQNEMQMLLYTHPVNDARADYRLSAINSFWISGTGDLPPLWTPPASPPPIAHDESLRPAVIQEDARAWAQAWAALDSGGITRLLDLARNGQTVSLSLCGEQRAITFTADHAGWATRMRRRFSAGAVADLLKTL